MSVEHTRGQAFNIGGEEEVSILGLAHKVKAQSGSESPIEMVPYGDAYGEGFDDVPRRRPDLSKIRKAVGWSPNRSLEHIIDEAVLYFRMRSAA